MIKLIKDINDFLCQYLLFIFLVILIFGGIPGFSYYINSLPDSPKDSVKCSISNISFENGTKATVKSCNGKITVEENSK